uniref:Uncharacterized protein n=1 Tax=Lepeophtheirus salmonis TaxID=72036 RepID=A0A0K2VIZ3_LEPSM
MKKINLLAKKKRSFARIKSGPTRMKHCLRIDCSILPSNKHYYSHILLLFGGKTIYRRDEKQSSSYSQSQFSAREKRFGDGMKFIPDVLIWLDQISYFHEPLYNQQHFKML